MDDGEMEARHGNIRRPCSTVTFLLHGCGDPLRSSDSLRDMVMSVVDQVKADGHRATLLKENARMEIGKSSERSARFALSTVTSGS